MPPLYELSDNSDPSPEAVPQIQRTKRAYEEDTSDDEIIPPSCARRRKAQKTHSPDVKLRNVLATLSDLDLSLYDLLAEAKKVSEASTESESQWQILVEDLAGDDRFQLQSHLKGKAKDISKTPGVECQALTGDAGGEVNLKQILRDEVQAVGRSQIFGTWKEEDPTNFFANKLPQAIAIIGQNAPHLTEILRVISLPVGNAPLEAKQGSLVSFFSILCHAQQPQICCNIPTQMSLYLHTNGLNKSVLQTLHRMGVCVNYDVSMQAMKEQSAKSIFSGQLNAMGHAPSSAGTYMNCSHDPSSSGQPYRVAQRTIQAIRRRGRPRKDNNEISKGTDRPQTPGDHFPSDESARLGQQLGVHSPTVQPPHLNIGSKSPRRKVTQPTIINLYGNEASPPTPGRGGSGGNKAPETTTPTMRPVDWPLKAPNGGSPASRSTSLTGAATNKGYGLLVPPHRSIPANHHNKGGTITFRVNRQSSNAAARAPLPPLPPALTNPVLPHSASPEEKLQYAMIMHNHSRLHEGQG